MEPAYTLVLDLARDVAPPADGILSRTLYADDSVKVVGFGFGAGQELSEHTTSKPAILQFLTGAATLTLGTDRHEAGPGTVVHIPAGMKHAIRAETPVVMLLILLKS